MKGTPTAVPGTTRKGKERGRAKANDTHIHTYTHITQKDPIVTYTHMFIEVTSPLGILTTPALNTPNA